MGVLRNIGAGVSDLLLTLLALSLIIRALLYSAHNILSSPLVRLIDAVTEPILAWPHKLLPPLRSLDPACWVCAFLVCALEIYVRVLFGGGEFHGVFLWFALIETLELTLYVFIVAVLVHAVGSWFMQPHQMYAHPLLSMFQTLVAPLLAPLRRALPTFGAVDVSPMVLLLLMYIALIVLRSF